ncbi:MAG: alpha-L-fucosidase [Bacteroidales bacterium]|nr:alpha-L-fucosidase [Bacteroidales bacterium]
MKALKHKIVCVVVVLSAITMYSQAQVHTNERARWFTDARFGMFIHWGVYSGAEGIWKG